MHSESSLGTATASVGLFFNYLEVHSRSEPSDADEIYLSVSGTRADGSKLGAREFPSTNSHWIIQATGPYYPRLRVFDEVVEQKITLSMRLMEYDSWPGSPESLGDFKVVLTPHIQTPPPKFPPPSPFPPPFPDGKIVPGKNTDLTPPANPPVLFAPVGSIRCNGSTGDYRLMFGFLPGPLLLESAERR
jgi:hypothetical protein